MLLHIDIVCTMEFTKKDILGLVAIPLLSQKYWASTFRMTFAMSLRITAQNVFLSLYIPSSFETSLALVFEDDVLDLRLVLENALARILRLLHLGIRNMSKSVSEHSLTEILF